MRWVKKKIVQGSQPRHLGSQVIRDQTLPRFWDQGKGKRYTSLRPCQGTKRISSKMMIKLIKQTIKVSLTKLLARSACTLREERAPEIDPDAR